MTRDFDDQSQDFIDEQLDQLITKAEQLIEAAGGAKTITQQQPQRSFPGREPLCTILNSVALRGRLFDRVIEASDVENRRIQKQRFIWVMQQSGAIWMPQWITEYTSIEDRADLLSETWLWFCEKFEQYVPEKASPVVMFNRKLRFRAIDLYRKGNSQPSIDEPIGDDDGSTFGDLLPSPDPDPFSLAENEDLRERVKACLENSIFINACVSEDHKNIHCRSLLSEFLLEEMDWGEIYGKYGAAQDRGLQRGIRRCYRERCLPRLRKCLSDQSDLF